MFKIRPFEENDWDGTWQIIVPVFQTGETYPYSPDITENEAHRVWIEAPSATYVAVSENDEILGTYYIKKTSPVLVHTFVTVVT